jgi:hypothetical protein
MLSFFIAKIMNLIFSKFKFKSYRYLSPYYFEFENIIEFRTFFGFDEDPLLEEVGTQEIKLTDINSRSFIDKMVIASIVKNIQPKVSVEIGTAFGETTLLMYNNCKSSTIYTVNAPYEDIQSQRVGKATTFALKDNEIGKLFYSVSKEKIKQFICDSKDFQPPESIDFAFIDGCHDKEYIKFDTINILRKLSHDGIIVWHDANIKLVDNFYWHKNAIEAIDEMFASSILKFPVFQIRNSFTLIYKNNYLGM